MQILQGKGIHLSFNNIHYVDTVNGYDLNDGTEDYPFKTMRRAIAKSVNGDAIYLKGESNEDIDYSNLTISVFGNYMRYGSKLSNIQRTQRTNNDNITFYGISLVSSSPNYTILYGVNGTFFNCIISDDNWMSNNGTKCEYHNCAILKIGVFNDNVSFTNCAFKSSLPTSKYLTNVSYLNNVVFNELYEIKDQTWKHCGSGFNTDGSIANIGLYGGIYECFDNVFKQYDILIPEKSSYYTNDTMSWLTTTIINKDILVNSIGFMCGRTFASGTVGVASARIYDENLNIVAKGSTENINTGSFTYSTFSEPILLERGKVYYIGAYGNKLAIYKNSDGVTSSSHNDVTIKFGDTTYSLYDKYEAKVKADSLQAEMSFTYKKVEYEPNFQHYALKVKDKYYIPNLAHYNTSTDKLMEVKFTDLYKFNNTIDNYITDVKKLYEPFYSSNKIIYPFDTLKLSGPPSIVKITGYSKVHTLLDEPTPNILTFYTDFTKIFKAMLIKLNDSIELPHQELNYFLSSTSKNPIKVGIECNSMLYGNNFEIINDSEIMEKGISIGELDKIQIPFDNVRLLFCLTKNANNLDEYFNKFKFSKSHDNFKTLLNHNEYSVLLRQDTNSIFLQVLDSKIKTLTVNKLSKINTEYRVKNTLNTF